MGEAGEDDDFDPVIEDAEETFSVEEEEGEAYSAVSTPSRQLAVRRALEARFERQRMAAALDYLELDFADEEE